MITLRRQVDAIAKHSDLYSGFGGKAQGASTHLAPAIALKQVRGSGFRVWGWAD